MRGSVATGQPPGSRRSAGPYSAGMATPLPTTFPSALAALLRSDPSRPLVTFYDDATGERIELSVTTYANWVAKTAGLAADELDAERGGLRAGGPPDALAGRGVAGRGLEPRPGRDRRPGARGPGRPRGVRAGRRRDVRLARGAGAGGGAVAAAARRPVHRAAAGRGDRLRRRGARAAGRLRGLRPAGRRRRGVARRGRYVDPGRPARRGGRRRRRGAGRAGCSPT